MAPAPDRPIALTPGPGLDEVVGNPGVVSRLSSIVVTPTRGWWQEVPGHRRPGATLLHGPSGGGKRFLAEAVARTLGAPIRRLDLPELLAGVARGRSGGETGPETTDVVAAARDRIEARVARDRCVVWLGGLDRLVATGRTAQRRLVVLLESLSVDEHRRAIFVSATSAPWDLDPLLFDPRRFERFVHVPPPDWAARIGRISGRAGHRRVDLTGLETQIALATAGWTGDEIDRVVDEVAARATAVGTVLAPMVVAALGASRSEVAAWWSGVMSILPHHDERGGFDDLVPHLRLAPA